VKLNSDRSGTAAWAIGGWPAARCGLPAPGAGDGRDLAASERPGWRDPGAGYTRHRWQPTRFGRRRIGSRCIVTWNARAWPCSRCDKSARNSSRKGISNSRFRGLHRARTGDKSFVGYIGQTVPVADRSSGAIRLTPVLAPPPRALQLVSDRKKSP